MNLNRIWLFATVIISLAALALGWAVGVSPKLEEAAAADTQRVAVEAQNAIHEKDLADIQAQAEHLEDFEKQLAVLQESLPPGDDLSYFIGQLHNFEVKSGVEITTVTISEAQQFTPAEASADGATTVTPENFIAIPVSITITGPYANTMAFVEALQTGKRLFLVTNLSYTLKDEAAPEDGSEAPAGVTAETTIMGFVYVLLDPSAKPAESTETQSAGNG